MSKDNPTKNDVFGDDAMPESLDAFEEDWVGLLAAPEADLDQSEDAFVQGVLAEHAAACLAEPTVQQTPEEVATQVATEQAAEESTPAVAGRIAPAPRALPYAAAAALLLAALAGWFLLNPKQPGTAGTETAKNTQPDSLAPQPSTNTPVANVDPKKIKLGKLIAKAQGTVTSGPFGLAGSDDATTLLPIDGLLDLFKNPVPDLKEILAPLEDEDQQSRA